MDVEVKNNIEAIEKLQSLIKDVSICMFATQDADGTFSSRPMTTIQVDENGAIWFFTNENSGKVEDQREDNIVYLIYSNPSSQTYIHIHGRSSVITDRQKIRELWKPMMLAWYPEGANDPKLALLKVEPLQAKYWNSSSSNMVMIYNVLKSIVTKERYPGGEVGTLNLPQQERTSSNTNSIH
jgi:general stress protein 26